MDIRMPVMDGLDATAQIMADPALAGVRVLILTTFDEDENVFDAIRLGAAGYLLKDIAPTELRQAIRAVAGGDAQLSPAITRKVMQSVAAGQHRPADEAPILCPHRARTGSTHRDRPRTVQSGDQPEAVHQPCHGTDVRQQASGEAERA
jgi:DNA-binding NarL/FixJ family response regulator